MTWHCFGQGAALVSLAFIVGAALIGLQTAWLRFCNWRSLPDWLALAVPILLLGVALSYFVGMALCSGGAR